MFLFYLLLLLVRRIQRNCQLTNVVLRATVRSPIVINVCGRTSHEEYMAYLQLATAEEPEQAIKAPLRAKPAFAFIILPETVMRAPWRVRDEVLLWQIGVVFGGANPAAANPCLAHAGTHAKARCHALCLLMIKTNQAQAIVIHKHFVGGIFIPQRIIGDERLNDISQRYSL